MLGVDYGNDYDGDISPIGYYNGNQTPLGPDMASGYGLYDVSGNVYEWTRSRFVSTVELYDQTESLTNNINTLTNTANVVIRGGSCLSGAYSYNPSSYWPVEAMKCYYRQSKTSLTSDESYTGCTPNRPDIGFRVTRRP